MACLLQIARLKRQLEDASNRDTSAAVAAATAASANDAHRSSEDDAELEELRERIEELEVRVGAHRTFSPGTYLTVALSQEENVRLQKLVSDHDSLCLMLEYRLCYSGAKQ